MEIEKLKCVISVNIVDLAFFVWFRTISGHFGGQWRHKTGQDLKFLKFWHNHRFYHPKKHTDAKFEVKMNTVSSLLSAIVFFNGWFWSYRKYYKSLLSIYFRFGRPEWMSMEIFRFECCSRLTFIVFLSGFTKKRYIKCSAVIEYRQFSEMCATSKGNADRYLYFGKIWQLGGLNNDLVDIFRPKSLSRSHKMGTGIPK